MNPEFRIHTPLSFLFFFFDPLSLLWPSSYHQMIIGDLVSCYALFYCKCVVGLSLDFLYKSLCLYISLYLVLRSPVTNT